MEEVTLIKDSKGNEFPISTHLIGAPNYFERMVNDLSEHLDKFHQKAKAQGLNPSEIKLFQPEFTERAYRGFTIIQDGAKKAIYLEDDCMLINEDFGKQEVNAHEIGLYEL